MQEACPIKILRDLVAFKSISKENNHDIVEYLANRLIPLGFEVTRIKSHDAPTRSNLLCKIGPDKPGGLMLSGHMDVVPVAFQNWDSDPFTLFEKDNRLVGRGAADMKGFIAATMCALTKIPFEKLDRPLTLLWTYDEEIGGLGSLQAAPLLKNYLSHLPKAALIGEPTDFNILRMHAGHTVVKLHVKGKGAHSSDPDLGISAIKAINQALYGVFLLEEELKKETSFEEYFKRPFVTINVGEIHGGTAANIIPDEAEAVIGFRQLPGTSVETMNERIVKACIKHQLDERAKISLSLERSAPAMLTKADTDLERVLRPFAKIKGSGAAQYGTDGGHLNQSGIECLIFGPGTIDVAHQANEWIDRNDLVAAVDKIDGIIRTWFSLS